MLDVYKYTVYESYVNLGGCSYNPVIHERLDGLIDVYFDFADNMELSIQRISFEIYAEDFQN